MRKFFQLEVDRDSWASVPVQQRKECPFSEMETEVGVALEMALLWIGVMSIPLELANWWLASRWAVLRYYAAAMPSRRLRLVEAVGALDAHQKTILSDDWGVGFSLALLSERFEYPRIEHGAAFMKWAERDGLVTQTQRRRKQGPSKCPDFVAQDRQGRFHVIECKGTQESLSYSARQIQRGLEQKGSFTFSNEGQVAQRLVTGFFFSPARSRGTSTVRIADPPADDERSLIRIDSDRPGSLERVMKRTQVIRSLLLAGLPETLDAAFPDKFVRARDIPREDFEAAGQRWFGQVYELPFAVPVELEDGRGAVGCRMRFGANARFVGALRLRRPHEVDALIGDTDLDLVANSDNALGEKPGLYTSIRGGSAFMADFEVLTDSKELRSGQAASRLSK